MQKSIAYEASRCNLFGGTKWTPCEPGELAKRIVQRNDPAGSNRLDQDYDRVLGRRNWNPAAKDAIT
jgi:hypothetical protein